MGVNLIKYIKLPLMLIGTSYLLVACSILNTGSGGNGPSNNAENPPPEPTDIDRRLSELETMKPSLMRLVSIESDIKTLIIELNTLADNYSESADGKVEEAPSESEEIEYLTISGLIEGNTEETKEADKKNDAGQNSPDTEEKIPTPEKKPPPAPKVVQKTQNNTPAYTVHLTSYRDGEDLHARWQKLNKIYPVLLKGLSPKVRKISASNGDTFLRLKAGPFATKAEAAQMCKIIRARHAYCGVNNDEGQTIEEFIKSNPNPSRLTPVINTSPAPAPPARKIIQKEQNSSPDYTVHISSYNDAENLAPGWEKLKNMHPELLKDLTPKVEWVSSPIGEGILRLKAGPLSKAEATRRCKAIRAKGAFCSVKDNKGSSIQDYIIQ